METNSEKKRVCTNCAFCQRFKYSQKDDYEMMRCWMEPSVCDHAFCQTVKEGDNYSCEEHMFREERDNQLKWMAHEKYVECKRKIAELEEKYPEFKEMNI